MDPQTLERLGRERQGALLDEAQEIRQARRLRLGGASPLRLFLARRLRIWAQALDRPATPLERQP